MRPIRNAVLISAAIVVAGVFVVALVANSSKVTGSPRAAHAAADGAVWTAGQTPPATEAPEPTPDPLDLNDFTVDLKVTDKQCFGSAGCNVTVEPNLTFVHAVDQLDGRSYSVTITITGDSSGPVITTISGTGQQYDIMPTLLSTNGPGVAPKGKVTAVEEY
jgi:hypothetical protein